MGLLDDLKKEAESLKNQEAERTQSLKANAIQVDQALRSTFRYLHELFRQLNVVKPECDLVYDVQSVGKLDGLGQSEYRIDYKTSQRNNSEHYEALTVSFRRSRPETFTVKRDAEQIEKFRNILWQNNMRFTSEPFRNERRVITHETFTINKEVVCGVDIVGDYDEGVIRFKLKNVEEFGPTAYTVEPVSVTDSALEELAKLLVGKTDSKFSAYNRKSVPTNATGQFPKYKPKEVQYQIDPTPAPPAEEEKKRGLFGLFKK
jgi:hypothetical protein